MKYVRVWAVALAAVATMSFANVMDASAAPKYSKKAHGLVAPPGKCGVNFYWSRAARKCLDARWKPHYRNY